MNKEPEFHVEVSNGKQDGYATAVMLDLPASWSEFHDAMERARVGDARDCRIEICKIQSIELRAALDKHPRNLYELNLLAQRLTMLQPEQKMPFAGLVTMEVQKKKESVPLNRLINLTFNTENCCVASHVKNDKELGRLFYDSEMFSEEAMALLDTMEHGSRHMDELLAVLSRQHRETIGGVFVADGYVENSGGDIQEVYVPGQMAYFTRSGAPVVLEVCKGFFNDPAYDNERAVTLDLPAGEMAMQRAAEAVGAASLEECAYRCADCLVPSAREMIDNAEDWQQANRFAQKLHELERRTTPLLYKALLEATECADLADAISLMDTLADYELLPEAATPGDVMRLSLQAKYPDLPDTLLLGEQAERLGTEMLSKGTAKLTEYGLLQRSDGGLLPELGHQYAGPAMTMEVSHG